MMLKLPSLMLLLLVITAVTAQNPPGVPPRQQQFDTQQMNVQEGHAQGHGQGHAQGQGHGHGHPPGGNRMRFQSEIHNADHILEHLQNVIKTKPKEQMSEEELEFHYFKMHDYDNNNKLDGVEIGKALTHFHDEVDDAASDHGPSSDQQGTKPPAKVFSDEEISNIVDVVIRDNDEDNDGYVEYFEFKRKQEQQRQPNDNQQGNP